jgi:sugar lactone lactonase YvrE
MTFRATDSLASRFLCFASILTFAGSALILRGQSIQTVAGGGSLDGSAANAVGLYGPRGIVFDSAGNLYVAQDAASQVVRIDRATGILTTIAGNGGSGFSGDGVLAPFATLNRPREIVLDSANNLYIADSANNRVRRIDLATGIITTIAGGGTPADGIGDGGPATDAALRVPWGLALFDGKLFISEAAFDAHRIRVVVVAPGRPDSGRITTYAGTGEKGFRDGAATGAQFDQPLGLAVDASGALYVADSGNNRVRRIDAASKNVTTYAGGGSPGDGVGDGLAATSAALDLPVTLAFDAGENLHLSGVDGKVRRVDRRTNVISTIATPSLYLPYGLAFDRDSNLYVTDSDRSIIFRITPSGVQSIHAGGGGFTGDGRIATAAVLRGPRGMAIDPAGNLFIADTANARVRRVDAATGRISTVAGSGGVYAQAQEGAPAVEASIGYVLDVALDATGNLYTADIHNYRIWKIDRAGRITTFAGGGEPADGFGDGGPATSARIHPSGVSVDSRGNVLIAEGDRNRVRRVDPSGIIRTIAGSGAGEESAGYSGDSGPANAAKLRTPLRAVADAEGNIYVSDSGNGVVRRIDATGTITTYAGVAGGGENLIDDVPALQTNMTPGFLALDDGGNLFIADIAFHRIRKIDARSRVISTVAGSATFYLDGDYAGDEGPARRAKLHFGYTSGGVAVRANGDLYVADTENNRVRAVYTCRAVSSPPLSAPAADATEVATAPRLEWGAVAGAYRYDLYLDVAGASTLIAPDLTSTSFAPSNLARGARYSWRVVAKGDPFCQPQSTSTSAVRSFVVTRGCSAPSEFRPTAPADGASVASTSLTLSWEPAAGASTYELYLGAGSSTPVLVQRGMTGTSTVVNGLVPGSRYSWFVQARSACDSTITRAAATRSFSVAGVCSPPGGFELDSPQHQQAGVPLLPVLRWSAAINAVSYDVYFGTAAEPPLFARDVPATSLALPKLERGVRHFWRVVAKSACDSSLDRSTATRSFTTESTCAVPDRPVITFLPSTVKRGQSYAMTWRGDLSLTTTSTYLVERSSSVGFTTLLDSQLTNSTSASFVASAAGVIFHRVRAIAECDPSAPGPHSEISSTTVQSPLPNVVFTVQPKARLIGVGERLEDKPESFALENIGETAVAISVRKSEIDSVPFFTIVDPEGGDPALLTLQPRVPKRLEIRFSGPPRDVAGAYEGVVFATIAGDSLAVTPYAFVTLKVGGGDAAEPVFEVNGRRSEHLLLPPAAEDATRPPAFVDIRNSGPAPMDLAAEIGPELWLELEPGWNDTPIPPNAVRRVRLLTRRNRAPDQSALPRATYLTLRTRGGKSARLLVQDNGPTVVEEGRGSVLDPAARSHILPEVVSRDSRNGNPQQTLIHLSNVGGEPVQVELVFTPTGADGFDRALVRRTSVIVPPNDVATFRDPLGTLFALAPPATGQVEVRVAPQKFGLISVRSSVSSFLAAGGAARYDVPSFARGEGASLGRDSRIIGMRADSQISSDLVLVETTGVDGASVRAAWIDQDGNRRGEIVVAVPRYGRRVVEGLPAAFGSAAMQGTLELSVRSGGGTVAGYLVQRAAASDSGTTLAARRAAAEGPNKVFLAFERAPENTQLSLVSVVPLIVSGSLAGAPSVQYRTAAVFSAGGSTASFQIAFVDFTGNRLEKSVTVSALKTIEFQNLLEQLFLVSGNQQGSLFVTHPPEAGFQILLSGSTSAGILSTVAAVPVIAAGSEQVTSATSAGQRPLYLDGIEQSIDATRGSRWSVILNETRGRSGVVRVRLYESGNRSVAIAQRDIAIPPRGRVSLDSVFAALDLDSPSRRKDRTNVLCVVSAMSGEASVSALGLAVDPASGDAKTFAFRPSGTQPSLGTSLVAPVETAPPVSSRRRGAIRP